MGAVKGAFDFLRGGDDAAKDAARASERAAQIQADFQREALDYLKQTEAIPQQYRQAAIQSIGNELGYQFDDQGNLMEGGASSIELARQNPLYQAILSGRDAGEESILRTASATGGLRGGSTIEDLARFNTDLENQALITSYNANQANRDRLLGLPSNANQIAGYTAGIGQTLGQGQIASAQALQQGAQNKQDNIMGLAQLGITGAALLPFSDRRLKANIKPKGSRNGFNWYSWDWNDKAAQFGLKGSSEGVIADEVEQIMPAAILHDESGYKMVNMGMVLGGSH